MLTDSSMIAAPASAPDEPSAQLRQKLGTVSGFISRLFGNFAVFIGALILPVAAVITEYSLRLLSNFYINPIPTPLHAALILSIPVSVIAATRFLQTASVINRKRNNFGWGLFGFAAGVALFYTIAFIPLYPIGAYLLAISPLGAFVPALFGLLLFSPLLALVGTLISAFRKSADDRPRRVRHGLFAAGAALSLTIIAAVEVPKTVTRIGLERLNQNPADIEAINLLRSYGSKSTLLLASYGEYRPIEQGRIGTPDLLGGLKNGLLTFNNTGMTNRTTELPFSIETARTAYFQVTGEPFYAAARPKLTDSAGAFGRMNQSDADRAGERVGGRAENTALVSSIINGTVDPESGFGYLEWDFVFRNGGDLQEEARMELALPPGAVVSRATLWINGEEHEAAFGEKKQVRAAYQQIVSYRRDPLLVTESAPNRVLVQCFPVPPQGGEMRIRIGLTTKAELSSRKIAEYLLPSFSERNFAITPDLTHSVWIESKQPLRSAGESALVSEQPEQNTFGIRGRIAASADSSLAEVVVSAERDPALDRFFAADEVGSRTLEVKIAEKAVPAIHRAVLVIDGSAAIGKYAAELARTIERLPINGQVAAVIAGDRPIEIVPVLTSVDAAVLERIGSAVAAYDYRGGVNNLPALAAGWDIAARSPGAAVIWIHGPQPAHFRGLEELENRSRRRRSGPQILSFQLARGGNRLLADLAQARLVQAVAVAPNEPAALNELCQRLNDQTEWELNFSTRPDGTADDVSPSVSKREGLQLARLAAAEEVDQAVARGQDAEGAKIGTRYRIVTPVSGAVVLETAAQYDANRLTPPSASTHIPSVPEPETWALALCAVLAAAFGKRLLAGDGRSASKLAGACNNV